MAKARFVLYKQRTGERYKTKVNSTVIHEANRRATIRWVKSIIQKHFPEFCINDKLTLLSKTFFGYTSLRACKPDRSPNDFAWAYLEITILKDPEPQPVPTLPSRPGGSQL